MHTKNISREGGPTYESYFLNVHYTAGISAPLLLRIFEEQSCTVGVLPCSSHWGSGSTCTSSKSGISLRVPHLLSHCPLWSCIPMLRWLCQGSCMCNHIMTQIGKCQRLKSNSPPQYAWLFLAMSAPDPIHCADTQTAVSVGQRENIWGERRGGLD